MQSHIRPKYGTWIRKHVWGILFQTWRIMEQHSPGQNRCCWLTLWSLLQRAHVTWPANYTLDPRGFLAFHGGAGVGVDLFKNSTPRGISQSWFAPQQSWACFRLTFNILTGTRAKWELIVGSKDPLSLFVYTLVKGRPKIRVIFPTEPSVTTLIWMKQVMWWFHIWCHSPVQPHKTQTLCFAQLHTDAVCVKKNAFTFKYHHTWHTLFTGTQSESSTMSWSIVVVITLMVCDLRCKTVINSSTTPTDTLSWNRCIETCSTFDGGEI